LKLSHEVVNYSADPILNCVEPVPGDWDLASARYF